MKIRTGLTKTITDKSEKGLEELGKFLGKGYAEEYAESVRDKTNEVFHTLNYQSGRIILGTIKNPDYKK